MAYYIQSNTVRRPMQDVWKPCDLPLIFHAKLNHQLIISVVNILVIISQCQRLHFISKTTRHFKYSINRLSMIYKIDFKKSKHLVIYIISIAKHVLDTSCFWWVFSYTSNQPLLPTLYQISSSRYIESVVSAEFPGDRRMNRILAACCLVLVTLATLPVNSEDCHKGLWVHSISLGQALRLSFIVTISQVDGVSFLLTVFALSCWTHCIRGNGRSKQNF